MHRSIQQSLSVSFDFPVVFTRDVFVSTNTALRDVLARSETDRIQRAILFVDSAVAAAQPSLLPGAERYFADHQDRLELVAPPITVTGGEAIKNTLLAVSDLVLTLTRYNLDRHAHVVVVGGGAVLDAVGFAAALVHRGLRLTRLPSTVLGQNDAGVGVKNAVNLNGVKNLIGTFAPPYAVVNDLNLLRTLPDREWTDGIAEAFKVALIKDSAFFAELCSSASRLRQRDEAAMERLVIRCAELHLEHIRTSGDPFELGQARPLDFGHWSAHKLESLTDHALSHGQAVAIGISLDTQYAVTKGWLTPADGARLRKGLRDAGFALWSHALEERLPDGTRAILKGLEEFREHLGGMLCITMPNGIGQRLEVHEMDAAVIESSIQSLRSLHEEGR